MGPLPLYFQIFFIVGPDFHLDFLDSPPSHPQHPMRRLAFSSACFTVHTLFSFHLPSSRLALLLHASSKDGNDGADSVTPLSSSARTRVCVTEETDGMTS